MQGVAWDVIRPGLIEKNQPFGLVHSRGKDVGTKV